jgi:hypothetical protein
MKKPIAIDQRFSLNGHPDYMGTASERQGGRETWYLIIWDREDKMIAWNGWVPEYDLTEAADLSGWTVCSDCGRSVTEADAVTCGFTSRCNDCAADHSAGCLNCGGE